MQLHDLYEEYLCKALTKQSAWADFCIWIVLDLGSFVSISEPRILNAVALDRRQFDVDKHKELC